MVPIAISTAHTQSNGSGFSDDVAHTLESGGAQAVAFNLRGREGGALPEVSEAVGLRASAGGSSNSYIVFTAKDNGADADDIAPTLRGMGHEGVIRAASSAISTRKSIPAERTVRGNPCAVRRRGGAIAMLDEDQYMESARHMESARPTGSLSFRTVRF